MDLKVMNKGIAVCETLFDDFDERPGRLRLRTAGLLSGYCGGT